MRRFFRALACLFGLAWSVATWGQENAGPPAAPAGSDEAPATRAPAAAASAPAASPDFSAAFAKLRALGLPSVKDALPRALPDVPRGGESGLEGLDAFVWEKKSADGGRSVVVMQCLEIPAGNAAAKTTPPAAGMDQRAAMMARQMMLAMSGGSGPRQMAARALAILDNPPEVNRLGKGPQDLELGESLVKEIAKAVKLVGTDENPFESYRVDSIIGQLGSALLFACHLEERGHHDCANRLAAAALTTPAGGEAVIDAAVTCLAEISYARAFAAYLESKDAVAFADALRAVCGKFPRGYLNQQAVRLVIADAARATETTTSGLPEADALAKSLRANKLSTEAAKLLATAQAAASGRDDSATTYYSMMDGGDDEARPSNAPWTLDPPSPAGDEPLAKLLARGIDALPVLLALAKDHSATPNNVHEHGGEPSGWYSSSRESAGELALRQYRGQMPRPLTVAEIACAFLQAALPGGGEEKPGYSSTVSPEDVPPMVEEWKAGLTSTEPLALSDKYLESGTAPQKSAAMELQLKSPDPARIARLETLVLDWHPRSDGYPMVTRYLTIRGKDADAFLARYTAAIEAEIKQADGDYFQQEWSEYSDNARASATATRKKLKQLAKLGAKIDVPAMLDEFARGKTPQYDDESTGPLYKALGKMKPDERLRHVLDAATRAGTMESRRKLLGIFDYINTPTPLDDAARQAWRVLLADDRPAYTPEERRSGGTDDEPASIGELAAVSFTLLQDGKDMDNLANVYSALGSRESNKLMHARAIAVVDGKMPPDWPDAAKVSGPRMDEIMASFEKSPPAAIAAAIDALNADEKIALLRTTGKELPRSLREAGDLVYSVELGDPLAKQLPDSNDWIGKPLDMEMVEKLVAAMCAGGGSSLMVRVHHDSLGRGLRVYTMASGGRIGLNGKPLKAPAVAAYLQKDDSSLRTVFLDEADRKALDDEARAKLDESMEKFRAAMTRGPTATDGGENPTSLSLVPLRAGDPQAEADREEDGGSSESIPEDE